MNINELIIPAARKGEIAVLQELFARNVDVNHRDLKGYTPLIIACYNNQLEAAKLLINNGANLDAADEGGNTALMGVSFKGYIEIAQLLIE